MFIILKHLKKSVAAMLTVTILLILQAYCDLSLPTYTSQIVNVGIMQGGIESPVPEVIRQSELDLLTLFLDEDEINTVYLHYSPMEQSQYNTTKWSDYTKKYPVLKTENLYIWDKNEEDRLETILSIPMMLTFGAKNQSEETLAMRDQLLSTLSPEIVNEDMDLLSILSILPPQQRSSIVSGMKDAIAQMPEMIVTQSAITYLKAEYEVIGVDVDQLQSNYILLAGLKMVGLALAATLASILVTLFAARIAAKMGRDLRSRTFQKVLSFTNTEMDQFSTASLITRSTNDIQQVQMLAVMLIRIVIYSPILAAGGVFKILNTNTSMAWTLAVGVGAIMTLITTLMVVAMPKFKLMQKLVDRINLVTREILTGLPVIRAFSTETHERKRFDKVNIDLTKNHLFVNRVMTFMMPALMLIMNLVSILILWVGADKINGGTMQVGDIMAFIQYTMQIIMSFLMLTMISVILPRAAISAKRIDEVLSVETVIHDPETEEEPIDKKRKGHLEFNNVTFRYPNAKEDVLSDISFVAKPGETTAIIGSTGSGKSTLINLIPRFYDVTAGSIRINGVDIRKMKQNSLRNKLGYVPQKGVLFSGSIESNIAFGKSDATKEDIKSAARIAQATEFIEAKPEGFNAPISQGGTNVSGGQKQRLSIARAIAKNPEIYIFDDSFSALDYKTDSVLRKTLKEELTESTVIIVAQRISTIMHAEQILVLDEGRIVGKGTHKDLLKTCEVYRQIASSQLSKEELEYE
ncbi:ABC transporter ATP-binding protein [Mobilitalea sibirica]|uniref:ABC transporter ATP-binding protein n=1 Tax=Mobilitalea sibirica TaxID=1462919 RepID=A0A8J7H3B3_9FIRM|nr:ABC transporter ATP-binding protein [Mobilitalea sibirica]MBH1941518.1 ABC transporter ATP-binding protein [Mobilitalea sibirica]